MPTQKKAGGENGNKTAMQEKRIRSDDDSGSDTGRDDRKKSKVAEKEEIKFMIKFKERSDKGLNPLKLSADIKAKMGDVLNVKTMMNGNVLIFCKSDGQRRKAMQAKQLLGRSIE